MQAVLFSLLINKTPAGIFRREFKLISGSGLLGRGHIQRNELALNNVPCVVIFVGAGGQGDNTLGRGGHHVTVKVRLALHLGQIVCVILLAGKGEHVGVGVIIAGISGKDFDFIVLGGGVQIEHRMCIIVGLLSVAGQGAEHGAVSHVVTVDDGVCAGEIGCALAIHKQGTALVVAAVKQMVEILVVVFSLSNDVVDGRIGGVYPSADFLIDVKELFKVNREGGILLLGFIDLCRVSIGVSSRCAHRRRFRGVLRGGFGTGVCIGHAVVIITGLLIFIKDGEKLIACEKEYCHANGKYDGKYDFCRSSHFKPPD